MAPEEPQIADPRHRVREEIERAILEIWAGVGDELLHPPHDDLVGIENGSKLPLRGLVTSDAEVGKRRSLISVNSFFRSPKEISLFAVL
jgi:hypothetical protein